MKEHLKRSEDAVDDYVLSWNIVYGGNREDSACHIMFHLNLLHLQSQRRKAGCAKSQKVAADSPMLKPYVTEMQSTPICPIPVNKQKNILRANYKTK